MNEDRGRSANPKPSVVGGRHYSHWVEPIRTLKRQGKVDKALVLLMECIEATERESGPFPAPWYTWEAGVIFRQRYDYAAEIEVLERWVRATHDDPSQWGASARRMFPRLERARELSRKERPRAGGWVVLKPSQNTQECALAQGPYLLNGSSLGMTSIELRPALRRSSTTPVAASSG